MPIKGIGGGGPGSKIISSIVLTYFKIQIMGIQELLTELKKIAVVPRYEPTKLRSISQNFAKCMENPGIWGV